MADGNPITFEQGLRIVIYILLIIFLILLIVEKI